MIWRSTHCDARMLSVIRSWIGTPYCPGSAVRGVGVDCVRFVASFIAEMEGSLREPMDRLPPDLSFHSPEKARAALRRFLRIYEPYEKVPFGETLEGGDILVTQPSNAGGPGHAVVVTPRPTFVVHALSTGVQVTSIYMINRIVGIYRPGNKNRWTV